MSLLWGAGEADGQLVRDHVRRREDMEPDLRAHRTPKFELVRGGEAAWTGAAEDRFVHRGERDLEVWRVGLDFDFVRDRARALGGERADEAESVRARAGGGGVVHFDGGEGDFDGAGRRGGHRILSGGGDDVDLRVQGLVGVQAKAKEFSSGIAEHPEACERSEVGRGGEFNGDVHGLTRRHAGGQSLAVRAAQSFASHKHKRVIGSPRGRAYVFDTPRFGEFRSGCERRAVRHGHVGDELGLVRQPGIGGGWGRGGERLAGGGGPRGGCGRRG